MAGGIEAPDGAVAVQEISVCRAVPVLILRRIAARSVAARCLTGPTKDRTPAEVELAGGDPMRMVVGTAVVLRPALGVDRAPSKLKPDEMLDVPGAAVCAGHGAA